MIVWLTIAAVYPLLSRMLYVEPVQESKAPVADEPVRVREPEELLLTAIYQREEGEREITAIYIEIFHAVTGNAYYMEVPVHTKVTLSTELYKKLQAYSPELPQYLKLSNMGDGFSDEYCLTGCNRILSEVLGVTIEHYIDANAETVQSWSAGLERLITEEEAPREFFLDYAKWLEFSESDLTMEERWVYYESYSEICPQGVEVAPGAEGLAEYIISTGQAKSRLQELMRLAESVN